MKNLFLLPLSILTFLAATAQAQQAYVPTFPGEPITTTQSGINGTALSTSPWTSPVDIHLVTHVVWTATVSQPSTLTKTTMVCSQSPDNVNWSPIPMCDDSAPPVQNCEARQWTWDTADGLAMTFYVPVNNYWLKCRFTGTTPGVSLLKVVGYKAKL